MLVPHREDDAEPDAGETAERLVVLLALGALGIVIGTCPWAPAEAAEGEVVQDLTEGFAAGTSEGYDRGPTGLARHGRRSGVGGDVAGGAEAQPVITQFRCHPDRETRTSPG